MSDVEQQQAVEEPQQQEQEEQLSEIQQLAREGKFKEATGGSVFCVICEKKSYTAETLWFEKLPYHKECFKCSRCAKKTEGFNAAKFDHKLYCRGCFAASGFNRQQAQVKWTPKASGSESAANPQFAGLGGGDKPCSVCNKKCYAAEAVLFEKNNYHADCLRCQEDGCGTLCNVSNLNQFQGKLLCQPCWNKGNYNKKQLEIKESQPKPSGGYSAITLKLGGGGISCTTCSKTCYPAETLHFEGKPYHQECLKCSECALKMTLAQANKFEENIFCTKCWTNGGYVQKQRDAAKAWKPKESTGEVNAISAKLGSNANALKCKTCEKTVYPAEALLYETHYYHPLCFKCTHCNTRIENINSAQHNRKNPYHVRCFQELNLHRADKA